MKHVACALIVGAALGGAVPAWGVPQFARPDEVTAHPAQAAGFSVAAAASNTVYFPLRLSLTIITAGAGGLTGWLTGGDAASARAVWNLTDGQAYITPAMLDGRERWRFGSQ